jgi:hypothetical protein
MKFLVDECLSPKLTEFARQHGHVESSHLAWIGKLSWKDRELLPIILSGDWTFVTRNSADFRGPRRSPGSQGQYATVELHAGLICLDGPVGMNRDLQLELFNHALDELDRDSDLVNQVLEVTLTESCSRIEVRRYKLPAE